MLWFLWMVVMSGLLGCIVILLGCVWKEVRLIRYTVCLFEHERETGAAPTSESEARFNQVIHLVAEKAVKQLHDETRLY
jgi:hypothetical protein